MASQVIDYYLAGDDDATAATVTLAQYDSLFVGRNGSVISTSLNAAISADDGARLNISGQVYASQYYAISVGGSSEIVVGSTGTIETGSNEQALRGYGDQIYVKNAGMIAGGYNGVDLNGYDEQVYNSSELSSIFGQAVALAGGNSHLTNTGTLESQYDGTVYVGSSAQSTENVVNSGTIINAGDNYALGVASAADGKSYVYNSGLIATSSSYQEALFTGAGIDQVTNTGRIVGETYLGSGDDLFDGRGGTEVGIVDGADGDDILYGSDTGADVLEGGTGADMLYGGGGSDTASYLYAQSGVTADLADPSINLGDADGDSYSSIENLTGSSYADVLFGDDGINQLSGGAGYDVLDGGSGADVLIGGDDNDLYYVDNSNDKVIEHGNAAGGANDTVVAFANYALTGQYIETLILSGTLDLKGTGNSLVNTIDGNAGNNIIDGKGGADTMAGAGGDDTYYVDNVGDNVVEADGQGNDSVYSSVSYSLSQRSIETLTLTGTDAINATGNGSANTLIGNAGANTLDGQGGADTMSGGGGNDIYYVDDAGDKVIEASGGGTDTVYSSVSFSLTGQYIEYLGLSGTGNINGNGNGQSNGITGNNGANILDGRGGNDTIFGSGGADTFLFDTALSASAFETITDFTVGTDMIKLDRTIFKAIAASGPLASGAFYKGTAAHDADDRIIYNSSTGDIFYDADGNGSGAAIKFAHVSTGLAITASSFAAI